MNPILIIIGIVIIPIYIIWGIRDYRKLKRDRSFLITSYKGTILFNILLVGLIAVLSNYANFTSDFNVLEKGYAVFDDEMILGLIVILIVVLLILPIITSKFKIVIPTPADFADLLPKSKREMIWFFILVVAVAIGEELIFREFYFELLHDTFHLNGDLLLLVSALIFGIVHLYQGVAGVIFTFFLGLLLGKLFQTTETLLIPIVLHFIIDIKFLWNIAVENYFNSDSADEAS